MNDELLLKFNRKSLATVSNSELSDEIDYRNSGKLNFPLHVFHEKWKPLIGSHIEHNKIDRSFIGTTILSALSTAAGVAFDISTNNQDRGYLVTWCCLVGISSSGKTMVMDKLFSPIYAIQKNFDKEWKEKIKELNDSQIAILKMNDVIINDSQMPTTLRTTLPDNPKGICKISMEINEWLNGMNPGKNNNEGTDEQVWLKIWNCSTIYITRANRQKTSINRPFINVIGGTQFSLVSDFFKKNRDTSGFTYRCLFAVDERKIGIDPDPFFTMPKEYLLPYEKCIKTMYEMYSVESTYSEPVHCVLEKDATELFYEWGKKKRSEANATSDMNIKDLKNGILGKMREYCLRFSALLAISDVILNDFGPDNEWEHTPVNGEIVINADVINRAIQLSEYYMKSAEYCYYHSKQNNIIPKDIINIKAASEKSKSIYGKISYAFMGSLLYPKLTVANQRQKARREFEKAVANYPNYFGVAFK